VVAASYSIQTNYASTINIQWPRHLDTESRIVLPATPRANKLLVIGKIEVQVLSKPTFFFTH